MCYPRSGVTWNGGTMVGRGELTEEAWTTIVPLLPTSGKRGGQWRDHRGGVKKKFLETGTRPPRRGMPGGLWVGADRGGGGVVGGGGGGKGPPPLPPADTT